MLSTGLHLASESTPTYRLMKLFVFPNSNAKKDQTKWISVTVVTEFPNCEIVV